MKIMRRFIFDLFLKLNHLRINPKLLNLLQLKIVFNDVDLLTIARWFWRWLRSLRG